MSTPLERAALLGTGAWSGPDPSSGVDGVDGLPTAEGDERRLLQRAGALSVYRRAGFVPLAVEAEEPAPEEIRPACSERTAAVLESLFASDAEALLPEALEALDARGLRLPHALIATALSRTPRQVRSQVAPLLGARGTWLGQVNPEWAWDTPTAAGGDLAALEQRWHEGGRAERAAALSAIRAQDAARGRTLLSEGFKSEGAEQRLSLLERMETGLSLEDEEWLQGRLTDRSVKVRAGAARLLRLLPESKLVARLSERARGWLRYEPPSKGLWTRVKSAVGAQSAGVLHLDVPAEFDKTWAADGVVEAAPQGAGLRAWWALQTLPAVPADEWASRFGIPPAQLVDAALASEFADVLLLAFTHAVLQRPSEAWIAPLWEAWASAKVAPALVGDLEPRAALLAQMTEAERDSRALKLLVGSAEELALLADLPAPWSEQLGQQLLAQVHRHPERFADRGVLDAAALAIPPSCARQAPGRPVESEDADWRRKAIHRQIDDMYALLEQRARFFEELDRDHPQ